jgi:hypothetical protein
MYITIITTILAFWILYIFVMKQLSTKEDFTVCDRPNILDEWQKMIPYWNNNIYNPDNYKLINANIYSPQGTPLPLKPSKMLLENTDDIPTVEGGKRGPRSLAVFAYNRASPECCAIGNGGYSTSGGCVCVTPKQDKWFGNVAGNRRNGYMGM